MMYYVESETLNLVLILQLYSVMNACKSMSHTQKN